MIDRKALHRERAGYVPRQPTSRADAAVNGANAQLSAFDGVPPKRAVPLAARAEYRPGVQLLRAHVAVVVTEGRADEYRERAPSVVLTAEQHRARLRR